MFLRYLSATMKESLASGNGPVKITFTVLYTYNMWIHANRPVVTTAVWVTRRPQITPPLYCSYFIYTLCSEKRNQNVSCNAPPPNTFVSGKSQLLFAAKSFQLLGRGGLCPWTQLRNSPRPLAVASIHWCPRWLDTQSFWSCGVTMLYINVQKA